MSSAITRRTRNLRNVFLWTTQVLLAGLFLLASCTKLAMPAEALAQQTGLSSAFMRFIAVCEGLGALGLLLPGIFRIRRGLTPLAAGGLSVIMVGAVVTTLVRMGPAMAVMPFMVGVLLLVVISGRRGWLERHAAAASAGARGSCGVETPGASRSGIGRRPEPGPSLERSA